VEKRINGLENKIAMITSAARGIARAFALREQIQTSRVERTLLVRTVDQLSSSDKAGNSFAIRLDVNLVVKGRVVIPAGSKVAATWDVALVRRMGEGIGKEHAGTSVYPINYSTAWLCRTILPCPAVRSILPSCSRRFKALRIVVRLT
jgi:hypothetical protein